MACVETSMFDELKSKSEFNVVVPSTIRSPESISIPWLKCHLLSAFCQSIVLSVVPLRVIPPPSAIPSVGVSTADSSKFLSSTVMVATLRVVCVPLTIKSPVTVRLSLTVVSDVVCPIEITPPLLDVPNCKALAPVGSIDNTPVVDVIALEFKFILSTSRSPVISTSPERAKSPEKREVP